LKNVEGENFGVGELPGKEVYLRQRGDAPYASLRGWIGRDVRNLIEFIVPRSDCITSDALAPTLLVS